MKMNPCSAFAKLSVRRRPFTCLFKILFKTFITVFIRNIEINHYVFFRKLHIMELSSIQIRQSRSYSIPSFGWSAFIICVLSFVRSTNFIKYRLSAIEFNKFARLFFFLLFFLLEEFVCFESTKVISNNRTIVCIKSLGISLEVVLKFLLKYPLREWICNPRIVAISSIHFPCGFKRYSVFFLKYRIGIQNKVIEIVRCSKHLGRNIIVVCSRIIQIYVLAMRSYCSKLKTNLFYCRFVIFWTQFISRRMNVYQSSNQT